jgi:alpha-beta hydrolase superfamily lysophospholipase
MTTQLPECLPVVVLITEAWHTPTHYSTFIDTMSALGYAIACPQLLTASTESDVKANAESDVTSSFHDDCSMIYQLVFDICCEGNDVLVIAHGYGGVIAAEALAELGKEDRAGGGKSGGVIGVIAVAGILPQPGDTLLAAFGGEWPDYIREHVWLFAASSWSVYANDVQ